MRVLELDPIPAEKLESLWATLPNVAEALEQCLDWIEQDTPDPRARRRRFTNGMWAVIRSLADSDWLVLWDEPETNRAVVRFIGETASL